LSVDSLRLLPAVATPVWKTFTTDAEVKRMTLHAVFSHVVWSFVALYINGLLNIGALDAGLNKHSKIIEQDYIKHI